MKIEKNSAVNPQIKEWKHFPKYLAIIIITKGRSFQKKFKQLLQPWRLNYMFLVLNESMKNFFGQIHSFSLFHWTCLASLRPSQYAS